MPFFGTFPAVTTAQKQTVSMDFGAFLPSGVTLVGTPTASLSVKTGVDPLVKNRITSGPIIGTVAAALGGSGVNNAAILLQVYGCLPTVQYLVEVVCSRSDGDIAEGSAILPCNPPGV